MPTRCHVHRSMGLDRHGLSQVENAQKHALSQEQGKLHFGASQWWLFFCSGRLVPQAAACAQLQLQLPLQLQLQHTKLSELSNAGVWRRCSRRTGLPHSQQDSGTLPRPLLAVVLASVKGEPWHFYFYLWNSRVVEGDYQSRTFRPPAALTVFSSVLLLSRAGVPPLAPCAFAYKLWVFICVIPLPSASLPSLCCHHMSLECFK